MKRPLWRLTRNGIIGVALSAGIVLGVSLPAYAFLSGSTVQTVIWPSPTTYQYYCATYQASIDTTNGWSYLEPMVQSPGSAGEPCASESQGYVGPNSLSTSLAFFNNSQFCSFTNTILNSQWTSAWYVSAPSQPTLCGPGNYGVQDHPWYNSDPPATYVSSGEIYLSN